MHISNFPNSQSLKLFSIIIYQLKLLSTCFSIYFSRGIILSRNYADRLGTRPDRIKYFLEIIFVKIVSGNVFLVPLKMRSTNVFRMFSLRLLLLPLIDKLPLITFFYYKECNRSLQETSMVSSVITEIMQSKYLRLKLSRRRISRR